MSVDLPGWFQPVMAFYGLNKWWPPIDEDKIVEFASFINAELTLIQETMQTVVAVMEKLNEGTDTAVFKALAEATREDGDSVHVRIDDCKDVVGSWAPWIAHGVSGYKITILGFLWSNCAADIAAITSGIGLPLVIAKRVATKFALELLIGEAKELVVMEVVNAAQQYFESGWLDDIIKDQGEKWGAVTASFLVAKVSDAGGGSNSVLSHDTEEVLMASLELQIALGKFIQATMKFLAEDPDIEDTRCGPGDRLIRVVFMDTLRWVRDLGIKLGTEIMKQTVEAFKQIIEGADEVLTQAEKDRKAAADTLDEIMGRFLSLGMNVDALQPPGPFMDILVTTPRAMGQAHSDAETPEQLELMLREMSQPVGTVEETEHDLSPLDLPVTHLKPVGTAHSEASSNVGAMDVDVEPIE